MTRILRLFAYALVTLPSLLHAAVLTGPDALEPGTLGIYTSDTPGAFLMIPASEWEIAVDSNGKQVCFATMHEGQYTLIQSTIEDGEIVQTTKTIIVGKATPKPEPEPKPEPTPEPTPSPKKVTVVLQEAERQALLGAVEATLQAMEDGTIRTPQGARSTFKNALWSRGKVCTSTGCYLPQALSKAVAEYEKLMDLTTVEGLKAGMKLIQEEQR